MVKKKHVRDPFDNALHNKSESQNRQWFPEHQWLTNLGIFTWVNYNELNDMYQFKLSDVQKFIEKDVHWKKHVRLAEGVTFPGALSSAASFSTAVGPFCAIFLNYW